MNTISNAGTSELNPEAVKGTVLVADDDPIVRKMLSTQLEKANYQVVLTKDGQEAIDAMHDGIAVALVDLHMPRVSGMDCLEAIRKAFPDTQVIMVTSSEDVTDAVIAMKKGALEYLSKPVDPVELILLVDRACRDAALRLNHRGLTAVVGSSLPTTDFSANSPLSKTLLTHAHKVAQLDSTVLITGESGTGKTTIARMIHDKAHATRGPLSQSTALPFLGI